MSVVPIHVDQASLSKGVGDMQDSIERTRALMSRIRGEVSASASFWAGSAAGSFGTLMAEYDRKADKLQQVLDNISLLVSKSNTNHQVNEEEQANNMNQLLGVLTA